MQHSIRFISLIVVICCLFLYVPVNAITIPTTAEPEIVLSSASGEAGNEVTVDISVSGNPGVAYLKLKVDYDADLSILKAENKGVIAGTFTTSKTTSVKPYVLQWMGADDSSTDGVIATVTFKIADTAMAGEKPISVTVDECYNADFDDVTFTVNNGEITVSDSGIYPDDPDITPLSDFKYRFVHGGIHITGYYGDDMVLNIAETYLINGRERSVTGIEESAFEANENITRVILPSTIEFIGDYSFYDCTALTEVILWSKYAEIGEKAFGYYYISRKQDGKVEGFALTAYSGSTAEEYLSENGLSFARQTKPIGKGDVDADGEYSASDLTIITKHLLTVFSLTGDKLDAADLNNDGIVNIIDLIRLKKNLIVL